MSVFEITTLAFAVVNLISGDFVLASLCYAAHILSSAARV